MVDNGQPPSDQPPAGQPAPPTPGRPSAEEMAKELRQSVRRNRRRQKGRRIVGLAALALLAALVAWWLWPRPAPVHVRVVVFDQLAVADQPTTLRIGTEPDDARVAAWGGKDVFFMEGNNLFTPTPEPSVVKIQTDATGQGTVEKSFPGTAEIVIIEASYVEKKPHLPVYYRDKGQVFVWPLKSNLLAIELTPGLKNADRLAALAAALAEARTSGWKVVYLATEPDRPLKYQPLRDWAHELMSASAAPRQQLPVELVLAAAGSPAASLPPAEGPPERLPTGPVLGRVKYFDGTPADQARADVLALLKKQFQGHVVRAEVSDKNLTLYVIRSPQADSIVSVPGSWQQLVPALKQAGL
jgi:hypothetical protein